MGEVRRGRGGGERPSGWCEGHVTARQGGERPNKDPPVGVGECGTRQLGRGGGGGGGR